MNEYVLVGFKEGKIYLAMPHKLLSCNDPSPVEHCWDIWFRDLEPKTKLERWIQFAGEHRIRIFYYGYYNRPSDVEWTPYTVDEFGDLLRIVATFGWVFDTKTLDGGTVS